MCIRDSIGEIENRYLTGEAHRKVLYHLYKLPQVTICNEKRLLHDGEVFDIDGIKIECFLVPVSYTHLQAAGGERRRNGAGQHALYRPAAGRRAGEFHLAGSVEMCIRDRPWIYAASSVSAPKAGRNA